MSLHQFDEYRPEFHGFSDFYESEIFPDLEREEQTRLDALSRVKRHAAAIAALTVLVLAVSIYLRKPFITYVFILAFGGMGAFGNAHYVMRDVRSGTKESIVGNLCSFLGLTFQSKMFGSPRLKQFNELGLVTDRYDRSHFEDQISGAASGAKFLLHEAHLEKLEGVGNKKRWVTKFRGQLLVVEFHQKFLGRTIVLRDKGRFQAKKKGDMKRVGLVDPVFEKIFEAYGTDQVEARYLLTPTFMQRLVDLENSVDGKNIRFGFDGGKLLIAIDTADRYEPGSMFKPLTDPARTQKILDEIAAVYSVVDVISRANRG